MTRTDEILRYMTKRKGRFCMTAARGWSQFNCTQVADVIRNLRRRGIAIETRMKQGKGCRYAEYRVVE